MEYSSDMCFEILSRTSLKTLDRCKSVCKAWNYLTYESSFMSLHCKRTDTVSGYFIQDESFKNHRTTFVSINQSDHSTSKLSLDFLPEKVNILASSNQGILCCVNGYGKRSKYYVCKPSTRQFELLPNPNTELKPDIFALVVLQSNPLRFKIVRLSFPKRFCIYYCVYVSINRSKNYYNYGCEIFDSQTWRWKELQDIRLPNGVLILTRESPVILRGAIHWRITNNSVLKFFINKEIYTIFSLPKPICDDEDDRLCQHKKLVEYRGQLGFICEFPPNGELGLWILKNGEKKKAWEHGLVLNMDDGALKREEPLASVPALYNAHIVVMESVYSIIFYNFLSRSFDVVKLDFLIQPGQIFSFRSDLEPVTLKVVE
ncbi:F-box protein At5g49610-like [Cornus florida]|uniref:F-box protein At5g49610-like n=1 Tax=Cornus florida TaxID=4283 RepID=UPI0028A0017F|nr:F-box protein At5g49610-like [Cornus florida]